MLVAGGSPVRVLITAMLSFAMLILPVIGSKRLPCVLPFAMDASSALNEVMGPGLWLK